MKIAMVWLTNSTLRPSGPPIFLSLTAKSIGENGSLTSLISLLLALALTNGRTR